MTASGGLGLLWLGLRGEAMNLKAVVLVIVVVLLVWVVVSFAVQNWDPAQKAIDKVQNAPR